MSGTTLSPRDVRTLSSLRRLCKSGEARHLRLAAKLSLSEAAAAAGTSGPVVYRWEACQREPHGPVAVRYGHFLEALQEATAR